MCYLVFFPGELLRCTRGTDDLRFCAVLVLLLMKD